MARVAVCAERAARAMQDVAEWDNANIDMLKAKLQKIKREGAEGDTIKEAMEDIEEAQRLRDQYRHDIGQNIQGCFTTHH